LGLGLFVWSLAQAAAGLVGSFWQFVIARVFLGAGEAPMFSGAARVVRDWWNVRDRGFVAAIPYACGVVGSIGAGWVTDRLMAGGFSHELIPDPNLGKGRRKG